jgi:DNA-binding response OmpR family regulator
VSFSLSTTTCMVRDVVGRYLGRAGYHVTVAGDGEEALFAALTAPPDL